MIDDRTVAPKRTKVGTVREWTIALGVLTAGNMTRAEAEMKLRAYVPLLQDNFPPGAFTPELLHHVASQCKFFPAYAEVIDHLRDWWRANRPQLPALPPPPPIRQRGEPTPEEIEHVTRVVAETIAALRASAQPVADWQTARTPKPSYLLPAQLDVLNPLPNGRKRTDATTTAASAAQPRTAPVGPDASARDTDADAIPF